MENDQNFDIEQDDLIQILNLIDESDFDELELDTGRFKLVVRKSIRSEPIRLSEQPYPLPIRLPDSGLQNTNDKSLATSSQKKFSEKENGVVASEQDGLVPIKAPMIGSFYRASSPGAPAFVEVGKIVNEDDIVCIIEVMKVMSSIRAGVRGRIVKILPENGTLVEYGQTLFLVKPEQVEEVD